MLRNLDLVQPLCASLGHKPNVWECLLPVSKGTEFISDSKSRDIAKSNLIQPPSSHFQSIQSLHSPKAVNGYSLVTG